MEKQTVRTLMNLHQKGIHIANALKNEKEKHRITQETHNIMQKHFYKQTLKRLENSDYKTLRRREKVSNLSRVQGYYNIYGNLKRNLTLNDFVSPISMEIPNDPYVILDSTAKAVYDYEELKQIFKGRKNYLGRRIGRATDPMTRKLFDVVVKLPKDARNKLEQLKAGIYNNSTIEMNGDNINTSVFKANGKKLIRNAVKHMSKKNENRVTMMRKTMR